MGRGLQQTLTAGDRAPEVAFSRLDDSSVTLRELVAGGPTLVAFFKASCPTCQYALPFLERLHGGRVQLAAVGQDDARVVKEFGRVYGLEQMQLLRDPGQERYPASNAFGITHVPSMFLVEPDWRISWSSVGFFRGELDSLSEMAGKPIFAPGEKVPEAKSG